MKNKILNLADLPNKNYADWIKSIQNSLKSKTLEELNSNYQSIDINPFVNPEMTRHKALSVNKRDWYIGVQISDGPPHEMNTQIMYFLENGAEAIQFKSDNPTKALDGVYNEMIYLDGQTELKSLNHHKHTLQGNQEDLHSELTEICNEVSRLLTTNTQATSIRINLKVESHIAVAIAKIRAMRVLWLNLLKINDLNLIPAFLYSNIYSDKDNPDTALIDLSAKAMYGALGGLDLMYLDGKGFDQNQRRIAMNIQHIMKMESSLNVVHDPLAGAYAIEQLTEQIAQEVWSKIS